LSLVTGYWLLVTGSWLLVFLKVARIGLASRQLPAASDQKPVAIINYYCLKFELLCYLLNRLRPFGAGFIEVKQFGLIITGFTAV
jgi:hypothetical protein